SAPLYHEILGLLRLRGGRVAQRPLRVAERVPPGGAQFVLCDEREQRYKKKQKTEEMSHCDLSSVISAGRMIQVMPGSVEGGMRSNIEAATGTVRQNYHLVAKSLRSAILLSASFE